MHVIIASTDGLGCGIAEHTQMLLAGLDPASGLAVDVSPALLDPAAWTAEIFRLGEPNVLHLNYHAGLHSRWTPAAIARVPVPVLVQYHDSGVPNSAQCKAICGAADYFLLHEPYDDLPQHGEYRRMGVPRWDGYEWPNHRYRHTRPIVGTVGHDFPWKCWDELARVAARVGWGMRICTPAITPKRRTQLEGINPWLQIEEALPARALLAALHDCDATAFVNVCHNAGQSGAILQGIGALKPVVALSTCRQYRALYGDPLAADVLRWIESFESLGGELRAMPIERLDPGMVALAEQESWVRVSARYAQLYQILGAGGRP